MALMYFTSATLCRAPFDKELCTDLLHLRARPLSEEKQNFDSYFMKLYNAVFALAKKVISAATAADRPFRKVLMAPVSAHGSEEMVTVYDLVPAAMPTFYCSQKDNRKATQTHQQPLCSQLSTNIAASFSEHTSEPPLSAASALLSPSPPSFCSAAFRFSAGLRLQVTASFGELSSGRTDDADDISRVFLDESDGGTNETPHLSRNWEPTRKRTQRDPHAGSGASQIVVTRPLLSKQTFLTATALSEKLEVRPRSVLKYYFRSSRMDTSSTVPSNSFGTDTGEPIPNCS